MKTVTSWLACLIITLIFAQQAVAQRVQSSANALGVLPGATATVDLTYRITPDSPANTRGMQLRLHYNASKIQALSFSNVFNQSLIGTNAAQSDADDLDADPLTDFFIQVSWVDFFNGVWPGQEQIITRLEIVTANNFTGSTTVRMSANPASGLIFSGDTIVVSQALQPDTTPPVISLPASLTVAATDASGTVASQSSIAAFLLAASANDDRDGSIAVINNDAPATFALGQTTVTFSASDAAGNTGSGQAIVTVTDQTKPVISLIGSASITLPVGASFTDPGAAAVDNVDGDISAAIQFSGSVNTASVGSNTLSYNVSDAAGNAATTITRSVNVVDGTAPVVTPPSNITVAAVNANGTPASQGAIAAFLAAATANDVIDGGLSVSNNAPSTFPLGTVTVTFSATDNAGNVGSDQATVTVTDQDEPVLTLIGEADITINVGDAYNDQGASAADNVDGDITANVQTSGSVDTSTNDVYSLTYTVSDNAGNAAIAITRVVTVTDTEAPVLTVPNNITVSATDNNGTAASDLTIVAFLAAARAVDNLDGVIANVTNDAPALFALGDTIVTFSVTDSSGNDSTAQATVSIVDLPSQVVSGSVASVSVAPEGSFSVTAVYNVSNNNANLGGLGVRIHFDSTALTWNAFQNVLAKDKLAQDVQSVPDIEDFDNDPSTDQYLSIAWASLAGDWPGILPTSLFDVQFTANPNFVQDSQTTLRFSSGESATNYLFVSTPINVVAGLSLDIDDNGEVKALSDGLLVLRHIFGFTGDVVTNGAVDVLACNRCDNAAITEYLVQLTPALDIDGDTEVKALSDGLLILRQLFGFSGDTLINGAVSTNCTRCTAEEVTQQVEQLLP